MNEKLGPYPINSIVCDDCLNVLSRLPDECIDLIYIDPPFGDNVIDKHFGIKWKATKEQLEWFDNYFGRCVRDHKKKSQAAHYLHFMHECLTLMYGLLNDTGSIYVHLDYRMNSYVRLIMDEIWGKQNLRNEIIWYFQTSGGSSDRLFIKNHNVILNYSKGDNYIFNVIKLPWPEQTLKKWQRDEEGRIYRVQHKYNKRYYIDEEGKRCDDVWDITLASRDYERVGFPTQKPEQLLKRVVLASSNPGGLVADFFCGSGTTLVVAERLGRNWLGSDINPEAIKISRERIEKERTRYPLFQLCTKGIR